MYAKYEPLLIEFIAATMAADPAHDPQHINRVVSNAKQLARHESANLAVVVPAAYLHDCFSLPKNHPERAKSSQLAAQKARQFLVSINYPELHLDAITHAITAHSYSAGITPQTLEAKVVQDADRLDALGAIGIARCIQVGSSMGVELYHGDDPFAQEREWNDKHYTFDHFYTKLFRLPDAMHTHAARQEAKRRLAFMQDYLQQLGTEIAVADAASITTTT
ncbi:HD domain-containing protein [Idiomarina xiamenensis]|uniref:Metal-dependent phosphohydrolase with HD region, subdomain n=1 Tax=Idiomarina xiamenensis 10-D-4 TaxID=740709 RepID=K2K6S7_9GAMM|nr:HD domain-containing protein [Idiomarina xiamenensis]EKE83358.1 Metal-dependent phosphohydrolase with HD region, subdomain [Idiomarina xiamenensis 10-D-4]